jgi:hypothetical protein
MKPDPEMEKIGYGQRPGGTPQSLIGKSLAFATGAVLLVGAIAISVAVFAVALTGVLVVGAYIWWKTRDLRKQMLEPRPEGNVIEGEIIEKRVVPDEQQRDNHSR